jgi:hypothetical protein
MEGRDLASEPVSTDRITNTGENFIAIKSYKCSACKLAMSTEKKFHSTQIKDAHEALFARADTPVQ